MSFERLGFVEYANTNFMSKFQRNRSSRCRDNANSKFWNLAHFAYLQHVGVCRTAWGAPLLCGAHAAASPPRCSGSPTLCSCVFVFQNKV